VEGRHHQLAVRFRRGIQGYGRADGLYELNLPYPTRKVSRSCWKAFNVGACPYSTAGALDLVHFPSADASKCDKGYDTANAAWRTA
jgi:hypothetical protein